jgi:predicted GH43/DUF377 family glycosyl hydrolase
VKKDGIYHMWYTGQMFATETTLPRSKIGYATSRDGLNWDRREDPVLMPNEEWEGITLFCPHVLWEEELGCFRMWYSGGRMHEADAIGIATSRDGIHWERNPSNPIFHPDPQNYFEMFKVEGCFVCPKRDGWYTMFYISVDGDCVLCISVARSHDGISNWQRHPSNPIIAGYDGSWDWRGVCKPSIVETEKGYMLWYNAANRNFEEIGLTVHDGFDLGFPEYGKTGINERGPWNQVGKVNYYLRDNIARYVIAKDFENW